MVLLILIFTFFFFLFLLKNFNAPHKNEALYIGLLVFIYLFIFSAFRNQSVCNDTLMYINHFNKIKPSKILSLNQEDKFEYGYQILENIIFLKVSKSPIVLLIITSFFIQMSNILFFFRNSKIFLFSIFLYIGLLNYFFTVSAIRQSIAIAFFNFAFLCLAKNKIILYIILILIAAQFHTSAYLLLLLPLLYKIKVNIKLIIIFFCTLLIVFIYLEDILGIFYIYFSYGKYYLERNWISESKLGTIFILTTFFLGFLLIIKTYDFENYTHKDKYMFLFYLLMISFWIFSLKISVLARYSQYFLPTAIILISNSFCKIKNIIYKKNIQFFLICFISLQLALILIYRPEWFMVIPYKFYWQ